MAVVGCYTIDLYCDTGGDKFAGNCPNRSTLDWWDEFTGASERDCLKQARSAGWTFKDRKTKAFCPKCSLRRMPAQKRTE